MYYNVYIYTIIFNICVYIYVYYSTIYSCKMYLRVVFQSLENTEYTYMHMECISIYMVSKIYVCGISA